MGASTDRSGFSLIEALVVLAIGGMALAIIFSIGTRAGDTGFRLGQRAMVVADLDIATGDIRSLIRSIAMRPAETINDEVDSLIIGTADQLEADIVAERATLCAPQGWAGRMVLELDTVDGQRRLFCTAGGIRTLMFSSNSPEATLSYSADGSSWSSNYVTPPDRILQETGLKSTQLFVRFKAGSTDIIEAARTGDPQTWIRFDAPF